MPESILNPSLSRFLLSMRNFLKDTVVIISGAAVTTTILAVQTYILYRQTNLIGRQTEAMSLDQVAHLRDHIIAVSSVEATTQRLIKGASFKIRGAAEFLRA